MFTLFESIVIIVMVIFLIFIYLISTAKQSFIERQEGFDIVNAQRKAHAALNKKRDALKRYELDFMHRHYKKAGDPKEKRLILSVIKKALKQKFEYGFIHDHDFQYFGFDQYLAKKEGVTFSYRGQSLSIVVDDMDFRKKVFTVLDFDDAVLQANKFLIEICRVRYSEFLEGEL